MNRTLKIGVTLLLVTEIGALADDWPGFRGPAGSGVAKNSESIPSSWSPDSNVGWKVSLPGPGASSPVIVDGRVLVTCYSGYGIDRTMPGEIENLKRNLLCVELATGQVLWQRDVKASLPEDPYDKSGVSSHGYASHTPVSDGINVYCFFGKGGVCAFDLTGHELWQAGAGKESDPPRWGSASSPLIHNDTVIVTAAAESQSVIGYDKATGKVLWRQEATGLDGMWGTPALVKVSRNRTDLVMLVAQELWGLDPKSGKLRWYTGATDSQQAYASVISDGTKVFAFTGGGSVAVDLKSGVKSGTPAKIWTGRVSTTYASPVFHQSRLYVVSRGILSVVDAASGDRLNQIRLKGAKKTGNARFGSLDYASPVVVGNRLFYLNASGQVYVFRLTPELQLLAVNEITTDREVFWGTPAVGDGRLVFRSSKHLYCVTTKDTPRTGNDKPKSSVAATGSEQPPGITSDDGRIPQGTDNHNHTEYQSSGQGSRPERPERPQPAGN